MHNVGLALSDTSRQMGVVVKVKTAVKTNRIHTESIPLGVTALQRHHSGWILPAGGYHHRQLNLFDADDGAMTRMFEAYRMLRTNVAGGDVSSKECRVILLTSSREAEGKTTTTCGLGITLARAGRRVLLIDGDLRRASLSRALSAGDRPGLIEMTGGTPIKMCVTRTSIAGLSLLPSGRSRQNLDEVLKKLKLDFSNLKWCKVKHYLIRRINFPQVVFVALLYNFPKYLRGLLRKQHLKHHFFEF